MLGLIFGVSQLHLWKLYKRAFLCQHVQIYFGFVMERIACSLRSCCGMLALICFCLDQENDSIVSDP